MFKILVPLVLYPFSTLGQEVQGWIFFRQLYGIVGFIVILAMLNSLVAIIAGYILTLGASRGRVVRFAKNFTIGSLVVQIILGFSPVIILARGIWKGVEFSPYTYGMPVFQIVVVVFCIYFQIVLIRKYQLIAKK